MPEIEVWHLSTNYSEHWGVYCSQPYRRGTDFRTFATESVTCPDCREVARDAWGRRQADAKVWGIA